MIIKRGQKIKTRSGLTGTVKALDWKENKVVSVGLEVEEGVYKTLYHIGIDNIVNEQPRS